MNSPKNFHFSLFHWIRVSVCLSFLMSLLAETDAKCNMKFITVFEWEQNAKHDIQVTAAAITEHFALLSTEPNLDCNLIDM